MPNVVSQSPGSSDKTRGPAGFKRPNFFVIGAEKAGTTTLCELLADHPDVFLSTPKEPNFFTKTSQNCPGIDWYESLFTDTDGFRAVGEGSTTYSKCLTYPKTARRIAEYAPDARIIYIVRDPIPRMESQWMQHRHMSMPTSKSFDQAVRTQRIFIDTSLYWHNLSVYRDHFPDKQILILFLEDLKADVESLMDRVFEFLELSPASTLNAPDRPRNTAAEKREDRWFLEAIRQIPGYASVRDAFLSPHLRQTLKPLLTRQLAGRPTWNVDTRHWANEQLREDNRHFLEFCGKPADFWSNV